ncbi:MULTISPECIES: hypothetical protein [Sphingomonadaceae]|jgi:hypothetical protein|uniref:hypothetical protein n=1 Tax=Sphingomonadales TaxID=204457 RepID=UPI001D00CC92|nr:MULTISPECIES: hypothetical protein [Sphingomonadaceae]
MVAAEIFIQGAHRPVGLEPGIDLGHGPPANLVIEVRSARSLVSGMKGEFAFDPDFRRESRGFLR